MFSTDEINRDKLNMQIIKCCNIKYRYKRLQNFNQLYRPCGKDKDGTAALNDQGLLLTPALFLFLGELMTKTCTYSHICGPMMIH